MENEQGIIPFKFLEVDKDYDSIYIIQINN